MQNSRKARLGGLAGLQDPAVMNRRAGRREGVSRGRGPRPETPAPTGDAWQDVATAVQTWRKIYTRQILLEKGAAFHSQLFHIARRLVRMTEETAKPNAERLREYRQSNLESLQQLLFSEAPIYQDLEIVKLADSLSMYMEQAGAEDELVRKVLAGKSPRERAAQLVKGTTLIDVAVRRKLAEGGLAAIKSSRRPDDPIGPAGRWTLAGHPKDLRRGGRGADAPGLRQDRQRAVRNFRNGRVSRRHVHVATRLRRGPRIYGAWPTDPALDDNRGALPGCGRARQPGSVCPARSLDGTQGPPRPGTPLNFVSTADIIGGNSGSPVVNRQGQFVGIIFDGNLQSLVWDFVYTDKEGRAIAVHSAAIEEALRRVYDAGPLADELGR